jgi:hypothetical protein
MKWKRATPQYGFALVSPEGFIISYCGTNRVRAKEMQRALGKACRVRKMILKERKKKKRGD